MLRIAALESLRRTSVDDPLLPVPDGCTDPDQNWMVPAQVIAAATVGDLARAVARYWLLQANDRWFTSNRKRIAKVTAELRDALPAEPEAPRAAVA